MPLPAGQVLLPLDRSCLFPNEKQDCELILDFPITNLIDNNWLKPSKLVQIILEVGARDSAGVLVREQ